MEVRVLGPLEVWLDGQQVDLGGLRQEIVLASLALNANRVVSIPRLTSALYGDDPPSTSRAQTQNCISSLRRQFAFHGHRDAIITRAGGYLFRVEPCLIDLHRFEDLLGQARAARNAGRAAEAAQRYRAALALWRGPALSGLDSQTVRSTADRLDDRRITATEECIEVELDLGLHADLAGELTGLIAEHPLRERLRGQLMVALYRSGRQAEALEVYRAARQTMIDELGIEPNEWLQQLERAILTSDPSLGAGPLVAHTAEPAPPPAAAGSVRFSPPAPNLLPTDIADFTGRAPQLDAIQEHLTLAHHDAGHLAVPVVVVVGKPGVGKTTLAVHVAHREAGSYPDGQLYADLHGRAPQRASPMQILERFLRAFGMPGNVIPDGLEERAEVYRQLLSDRRMLIVLDNAGGESQVLPLLPGSPGSAVMITSRSRLAGLPGAFHVDVDVLEPRQSIELLSRIAGPDRVRAEAETAAELARLCGQLPLALRIAGARLAARPHWSLAQLVERLANGASRLDELNHAGMGIRASLSLACEALDEPARRLFRRLALLEFPTFSGWVSAALLDRPVPQAQDVLDDLADTQLVETTDAGYGLHSQYRFHELIRVFARERLVAEEGVEQRNAALRRALGGLLFLLSEAHRHVYGGDYLQVRSDATRWALPAPLARQLVTPPMAWFERERATIAAAVGQAAQAGLVDLCWDLAVSAVTLFEARAYLNDWRETHEIALAAVRRAGDTRGEAAMLYSTGSLHIVEHRFEQARGELEQAARLFRSIDDARSEALAERNIAYIDRVGGDLAAATARYERALRVFRDHGDPVAAAYVLHGLAQTRLDTGGSPDAEVRRMLSEALALSRQAGSRRVEAQVLHRLGDVHLRTGDPGAANEAFGQALHAVRELGDPVGEAYVLHGLGVSHLRTGDLERAGSVLRDARDLATGTGERLVEARTSLGLGELALARGHPAEAADQLRQALEILHGVAAPRLEARVRALLADADAAAGAPDRTARTD